MNCVRSLGTVLLLLALSGCVSTGGSSAPEVSKQDLGPVRTQIEGLAQLAAEVNGALPDGMDEAMATELTAMQARLPVVGPLKAQGCIGESNRGYLRLQDSQILEDKEVKNEAQKILAAENKSRKALYRQVTEMNKASVGLTVTMVEGLFALERLKRTPNGGMVQLPKKGALLDEALALERVKALGADAVAEAWVALP
mgnify:CR=1 FL=1